MRRYAAVVLAMIVGACGGGDDVSGPPDGETFTLTISGEGTGAGQIRTPAGVVPSIDCTVGGGAEPAGTCSATYPGGSVVNLTAEPGANSSFDGWAGDVSGCTTLTCSLTMDQNRTIVASFATTTGADVEVASSAYYIQPEIDGDGAVIWVAEARNTGSQVVESAEIQLTSRDASGTVLASDFIIVGPIPPGETRAGESLVEYLGTETSVDIQVGEVLVGTEDPGLGAAQIVSSDWRVDPEFEEEGAVPWTVEVQNTTSSELEAQVDFATYDANGKIIAYDLTFVGPIPPGERRSGEGFADLRGNEAEGKFQIASVFYTSIDDPAASIRTPRKPASSSLSPE